MELPIENYFIIGSYPLDIRESKDIDVICYKKDIKVPFTEKNDYTAFFTHEGRKVECLLADNQASFQTLLDENHKFRKVLTYYEILFGIKAGHIIYPNKNWDKHISDYHILKGMLGGNFYVHRKTLDEFIFLHRKCTGERIGRTKTPKLIGVSKDKFFDDKVIKYVEHDWIHEVMAHKEKPMFTYMQKSPTMVECDREMWNNFSYEEKSQAVMEEAYVIAIERHVLPSIHGHKVGFPPDKAFKWALMRICTNLCSGWFREYAINAYFRILNTYNKNYVNKFLEEYAKQELVQPQNGELVA